MATGIDESSTFFQASSLYTYDEESKSLIISAEKEKGKDVGRVDSASDGSSVEQDDLDEAKGDYGISDAKSTPGALSQLARHAVS